MTDFTFLDNVTPETAVLEAAALSIAISKGRDAASISVISNFFLLVGDSLGLISSKMDLDEENQKSAKEGSQKNSNADSTDSSKKT